jgi:hypothetical protein
VFKGGRAGNREQGAKEEDLARRRKERREEESVGIKKATPCGSRLFVKKM